MLKEELDYINKLNDFYLVQYFQDGVVARATGSEFDNQLYTTPNCTRCKMALITRCSSSP